MATITSELRKKLVGSRLAAEGRLLTYLALLHEDVGANDANSRHRRSTPAKLPSRACVPLLRFLT